MASRVGSTNQSNLTKGVPVGRDEESELPGLQVILSILQKIILTPELRANLEQMDSVQDRQRIIEQALRTAPHLGLEHDDLQSILTRSILSVKLVEKPE